MLIVAAVDAFYCGGVALELNLLEKSSRVLRCYQLAAAVNDDAPDDNESDCAHFKNTRWRRT